MGIIVLVIIGVAIWLVIGNDNKKPKKTTNHRQSKADKEFQDMNLSLKDVDDDFNTF